MVLIIVQRVSVNYYCLVASLLGVGCNNAHLYHGKGKAEEKVAVRQTWKKELDKSLPQKRRLQKYKEEYNALKEQYNKFKKKT